MKVFIVFAAALLAVSALPTQQHWTSFKAKHGKSYATLEEEKVRFQIFQNNVQKVNAHNDRYEAGLETYTMAVNKFADMTPKEFGAMLRRKNGPVTSKNLPRHVQTLTAPEAIDWRERKAVLEVKDQGQCGSCWAFSTTGALEGQNAIKNNVTVPLSEQQLVDCDTDWNEGCNGGDMLTALKYVIKNGLNSEAEYPYEGVDGRCRAKSDSVVQVKEGRSVEPTEEALREAVGTVGPISVAIYADPIQFYDSGIYESEECYNDEYYLDHGVLAVAYGTENGKKFWVVKNSWGADWGEDGFFRLARDADQCGIALDTSYPSLA